MTHGNKLYAGLLIICWHLLAIFVEYLLLTRVYRLVPGLRKKTEHIGNGRMLNDTGHNYRHMCHDELIEMAYQ